MFKKRRGKKKRPRADLPSSDRERQNDLDPRKSQEDTEGNPSRHDLLAATRAEQEERKRRRVAIHAGTSSTVGDTKRKRSSKLMLSNAGAVLSANGDESDDKDMRDFIAARMASSDVNPLKSPGKSSDADGNGRSAACNSDMSSDAYAILRRQKKTLAAEAGGASDIAGSGIAGIGIFEVNLSDDERLRNVKATAEALASAMSDPQPQSRALVNLPASFSGNFVSRGKMMLRQPAVRMADGNINSRGFSSSDRPRDRESLRNFIKNDRR
eukprot:g3278.t1